ncbi:MAG TPA: signal peptide peptidase SppA [Vicinamibacterales bacterium]|nr:signal peptide peptidase SppA [Vicinamibacterales bacterium]
MAKRGLAIVFTLIGVAVVLSIAGFVALYFLVGRAPAVPANAILVLEVGGDLSENAPTDVVTYLRGGRTPTVRSVVDTLRKAKVDRRVAAVLLKPTGFSSPYWGKVQELRDAVIDFKTSGKAVYAYLEYADDRNYYLATAADRIVLMPSTTLDLTGVATYALFLRGTFDKFGVVPDMHHIGEYKTAVNAYTEKTYTPAHKQMDEWLNRDLFEQIVKAVADTRRKSEAEVRALIDEGPFLADAALRAGLIDEIGYEDQATKKLQDDHGRATTIDAANYSRVNMTSLGLNRGPRIAVIYASGAIVGGRGGYDPLNGETVGSDTLIEAIRDARKDSSVRAIVLRIDSPGGSATASDAIWRELMLARDEKKDRPLVVSMSDLAASGGYYIAMPGEVIVAQPSTLTGSIGIFGGKLVMAGAYEKLGAHIESTSIGRNAEMGSPARPFNASELQKVESQLRAFYGDFVRKAAESRHTTPEKIDSLAQGRVWTGRQAKDNGLVDELGGLDRAIAIAKERAHIAASSEVEVVGFPQPKSFYQMVSEGLAGNSEAAASAWMAARLSNDELTVLRALRGTTAMFRRGEALALMPFTYVR